MIESIIYFIYKKISSWYYIVQFCYDTNIYHTYSCLLYIKLQTCGKPVDNFTKSSIASFYIGTYAYQFIQQTIVSAFHLFDI